MKKTLLFTLWRYSYIFQTFLVNFNQPYLLSMIKLGDFTCIMVAACQNGSLLHRAGLCCTITMIDAAHSITELSWDPVNWCIRQGAAPHIMQSEIFLFYADQTGSVYQFIKSVFPKKTQNFWKWKSYIQLEKVRP